MSAAAVPLSTISAARATRASFVGLLRAELFKLTHHQVAHVLVALYLVFVTGGQLLLASGHNLSPQLASDPLNALYFVAEGDLSIVRIFVGVVLLVLSTHAVGLEYSQGTIRILLGRGVGRLRLLAAKVMALALAALALIAAGILIELAGAWLIVGAKAGGQHPWSALNSAFWSNAWVYLLCVLISAGVTLLLGVTAAVVGRSLAFGLAVGLSWFAVDNLLLIPLGLLGQVTHSTFWLKLSGLLLGPLLNRLPDHLVPAWHEAVPGLHGSVTVTRTMQGFGPIPPTPLDGRHALTVIALYAALFLFVSVVLMWRRDVME
jgi:ABC-type transport system involved in multi-copper enzyme maturation permease subunit